MQLTIDKALHECLMLENWGRLSESDRADVAFVLAGRLRDHGHQVVGPLEWAEHGPPDRRLAILQWCEPWTGMVFSLIPGGTFRPGYDDTLMDRFLVLNREIWVHQLGASEEDLVRDYPDLLGLTGTIRVFGSAAPCDLRLKPPVEVLPMLMATELIPRTMPGLDSFVDPTCLAGPRGEEVFEEVLYLPLADWSPVLRHHGWALPTSAEFEWALAGGAHSLFYWGNEAPTFLISDLDSLDDRERETQCRDGERRPSWGSIMTTEFETNRERAWPWCNRFGLSAMLARSTWCEDSGIPGDPCPWTTRGGLEESWLWQACGEWMPLFSAVEHRRSAWHLKAAVRPIIRIATDEG